jgi:hypothetical protein
VARSIRERDICSIALAADLIVPPLGMLVGFCFALVLAAMIMFMLAGWFTFFVVSMIDFMLLSLFLTAAWLECGRELIGPRELVAVILHVISVTQIGVEYLAGKRSAWVRTERR